MKAVIEMKQNTNSQELAVVLRMLELACSRNVRPASDYAIDLLRSFRENENVSADDAAACVGVLAECMPGDRNSELEVTIGKERRAWMSYLHKLSGTNAGKATSSEALENENYVEAALYI